MSVFPEASLERRIERILTTHSGGVPVRQECRCGEAPGHLTLAEHQAEMLVAELDITEEWSHDVAGPEWMQYCRWVTATTSYPGPKRIAARNSTARSPRIANLPPADPRLTTTGVIEGAKNSPECFKCEEPITEFSEVRIVTVRVDGEAMNVWVHAEHANPDPT